MFQATGTSIPPSTLTDPVRKLASEGLEFSFRIGFRSPPVLFEYFPANILIRDLILKHRELFVRMYAAMFNGAPPELGTCPADEAMRIIKQAASHQIDTVRTVFMDSKFTIRGDVFATVFDPYDLWQFIVLGEIHPDHHDLSSFNGDDERADAVVSFLAERARSGGIANAEQICARLGAIDRLPEASLRRLISQSLNSQKPIRSEQIASALSLKTIASAILWSQLLLPVLGLRRASRSATQEIRPNPFLSELPYTAPASSSGTIRAFVPATTATPVALADDEVTLEEDDDDEEKTGTYTARL